MGKICYSILIIWLVYTSHSQYLLISQPANLVSILNASEIKVRSSPIGFKPKIGSLHGKLVLASPLSGCSQIQSVQSQMEDIFVLVDDRQCLQSMKAKNIAASGAFIGIVKRNINNTIYDKQIDVVHIPLLEMQPESFEIVVDYMRNNPSTPVSALADFTPRLQMDKKRLQIELWLTPTQRNAYEYISQFKNFFYALSEYINFQPHFILNSQQRQGQYLGCLSSGKYCSPQLQYEGSLEGEKIVSEVLRQKIIAASNINSWLQYASYFSSKCLVKYGNSLWKKDNIDICSENLMFSCNINSEQIQKSFFDSFQGPNPEVHGNTYLQQQRQLFLDEKISKFPLLLINKREYLVNSSNIQDTKGRICFIIHPDPNQQPQQCQKITNPSLFTSGEIFIMIGLTINILICLMIACKMGMKRKMRSQIQNQVESTLTQYYRYMQTLEDNGNDIVYQARQDQNKQVQLP